MSEEIKATSVEVAEEVKKEDWRNRNVLMLLYPDNPEHKAALEKVKNCTYKYAAILHDRDRLTEKEVEKRKEKDPDFAEKAGDLKKAHYHICFCFRNAHYGHAVAKEFGIEERFLKPCGDKEVFFGYMLHVNEPDKFQYDIEDVEGPLVGEVAKILKKSEDEGVKVCEFLDAIDAIYGPVSFNAAIRIACRMGLYSEVRRGGMLIAQCIKEHNSPYERKEDLT